MQSLVRLMIRSLARTLVLIMAPLFWSAGPVSAESVAVALDGVAIDTGAAQISWGFAVAADPLGNYYVVDQAKHQVVKFDEFGGRKLIIGSFGWELERQLYYPMGVAVGTHSSSGATLIYVADTANSEVNTYDTLGHFRGTFSKIGPGSLLNPGGIAFLATDNLTTGNLVLVADTRNHRVAIFTSTGAYLREFRCSSCPAGGIRPLGVSARLNENGSLVIYVVDEFTHVVQVLNSSGRWVRSIGTKGTGKGQLFFPDELAVDADGNVWVANGGNNNVVKYGPDGTFLYSIATSGSVELRNPKGVGVDQKGKIYVATGTADGDNRVYRFREEVPRLIGGLDETNAFWVSSNGAWFRLAYNGLEQTCRGTGTATIEAPAGTALPFDVVGNDGNPITFGFEFVQLKMDMTTQQTARVSKAWNSGKKISVSARLRARCQDGTVIQKNFTTAR